tara:strand:+ start:184 stop:723 length:540 start_codon:yes stop_codon:yes gene_type:complete
MELPKELPQEVIQKFYTTVKNRNEMNKVLHFCLSEFRKVDRFFEWKRMFENMTNLGIIDDDEASREYCTGLREFYNKLLQEIREVEESDLTFIGECEGEYDKSLFHDNMVIGVCLLNDVDCYDETEKKVVNKIGGCMLRIFKHNHTFERLQKFGDSSHLFDDPIDLQKREAETRKEIFT